MLQYPNTQNTSTRQYCYVYNAPAETDWKETYRSKLPSNIAADFVTQPWWCSIIPATLLRHTRRLAVISCLTALYLDSSDYAGQDCKAFNTAATTIVKLESSNSSLTINITESIFNRGTFNRDTFYWEPLIEAPSIETLSIGKQPIGTPSIRAPTIGTLWIRASSTGTSSFGTPLIGAPSSETPSVEAIRLRMRTFSPL